MNVSVVSARFCFCSVYNPEKMYMLFLLLISYCNIYFKWNVLSTYTSKEVSMIVVNIRGKIKIFFTQYFSAVPLIF